jgi:hypothetical protein
MIAKRLPLSLFLSSFLQIDLVNSFARRETEKQESKVSIIQTEMLAKQREIRRKRKKEKNKKESSRERKGRANLFFPSFISGFVAI